MMRRRALFLTAFVAVGVTNSSASAQVFVNESTGTPVLHTFMTLTAGVKYYFTTSATTPLDPNGPATQNPVLTLMRGSNDYVAGAQFCGFDFKRACFTFIPSVTGSYLLLLHGDNTLSPGRATVWRSQMAYCTTASCDHSGPTDKFNVWNNVTFGGDTVSINSPSSGRLHYHTLHRPGNALSHTLIARSTNANYPEFVSRVAINGTYGTGRILGTVKFDTTDPAGFGLSGTREFVVGPAYSAGMGAVRLVRNRWFEAGLDPDGDGLSTSLEQGLKTCSNWYDFLGNGVYCDTLHQACRDNPSSTACSRSLRDTDGDGLRDDLEVYGYDSPTLVTRDQLFPRWGALPNQVDVFVEMDVGHPISLSVACDTVTWVNNPNSVFDVRYFGSHLTGVTSVGDTYVDVFDRINSVYSQAPSSINPNRQPGIRVHYDVGVSNPDPLDTRWGNWGGGNTCVRTNFDGLQPGDPQYCGRDEAYLNDPNCSCPSNNCFHPERRWTFRYAVDGSPSGASGGQAFGPAYGGDHTAHHVHELGHTLGLSHGGQEFTVGAYDSGGVGNYNAMYPSRINYRFQNLGGVFGEGDGLVAFSEIGFSSGTWSTPFNTRSRPEIAPVAGTKLGLLARTRRGRYGNASGSAGNPGEGREIVGCPGSSCNVDWNMDGNTTGTSDSYLVGFNREERSHRASSFGTPATSGPADLAVVGSQLVHALPFGGVLTYRLESNGDCYEWPTPGTGNPYEPCLNFGQPISATSGGTPIAAQAVALRGSTLSSGTGAIVVYRNGTSVSWAETTFTSATNATEGSATTTVRGVVGTGAGAPVLAAHPDGGTLLSYLTTSGNAVFRRLPVGSTSWSAAVLVVDAAGQPRTYASTPAFAEFGGSHYLVGNEGTSVVVRKYVPATARWTLVSTIDGVLAADAPIASVQHFELLVSPSIHRPGMQDFWVFFRDGAKTRFTRAASPETPPFWWNEGGLTDDGWVGDFAFPGSPAGTHRAAVTYDGRLSVAASYREVRLIEDRSISCSVDAPCGVGSCIAGVCEVAGTRVATHFQAPFFRSLNPSRLCDYDDWTAMRQGACRKLGAPPTGTDDFVRTPYSARECDAIPWQREPNAVGSCQLTAPRLAPGAIVIEPEYICENP